jgi:hypothetical protein
MAGHGFPSGSHASKTHVSANTDGSHLQDRTGRGARRTRLWGQSGAARMGLAPSALQNKILGAS